MSATVAHGRGGSNACGRGRWGSVPRRPGDPRRADQPGGAPVTAVPTRGRRPRCRHPMQTLAVAPRAVATTTAAALTAAATTSRRHAHDHMQRSGRPAAAMARRVSSCMGMAPGLGVVAPSTRSAARRFPAADEVSVRWRRRQRSSSTTPAAAARARTSDSGCHCWPSQRRRQGMGRACGGGRSEGGAPNPPPARRRRLTCACAPSRRKKGYRMP